MKCFETPITSKKSGGYYSMNRKIIYAVLMLAVAVSCTQKTEQKEFAVAFSGIVNFIQGKVTFEKGDTKGPLKVGDKIDEGMRIITTGDKSVADIYLGENAVRIAGNSSLLFSKLSMIKDGLTSELLVENGNVFSKITKKLGKDESYTVKTPHAVAAVRGTEFLVSEVNGKSNVACLDGKVEVKDAALANRTVTLDPKEEVDVAGSDLVKKQISDDKMRILKNLSDIRAIQDNIKQKYEDQKADMRRKFEEDREAMKKAVTDQKEKDKANVEGQKARDKANIEDQKARDKANIDAIKGNTKDASKASTDAAKNTSDSSKADVDAAKKSADDAKASVKPKIDPNQFKTQK
jgi:hypothetical protein